MEERRGKCVWCGKSNVKFAEKKKYCVRCKEYSIRECDTCHKPYDKLSFFKSESDTTCKSCEKRRKSEKMNMEAKKKEKKREKSDEDDDEEDEDDEETDDEEEKLILSESDEDENEVTATVKKRKIVCAPLIPASSEKKPKKPPNKSKAGVIKKKSAGPKIPQSEYNMMIAISEHLKFAAENPTAAGVRGNTKQRFSLNITF